MKPLKVVKYLVVHCVANRCNKPFSIPLLSESVQGIHVKGYNWCSLGIVYEGGLDEQGHPADTRTEAQKHALYELLKDLTRDYPDARILGHCEFPRVAKACPCFMASKAYADLQPSNRQ